MDLDGAVQAFREFVAVIKALRTPGTGCPWDLEQTHQTLRPYLIEEAYEVLDAIYQGDDGSLREELGDLLLQVVLHAQVADDRAAFSITEVVRGITEKMVRRHPHVFGGVRLSGAAEVLRNWEQLKAAESEGKGDAPSPVGAFARIPRSLPGLLRAQEVGKKAAKIGAAEEPFAAALDRAREAFAALEGELRSVGESADPAAPSAELRDRLNHEMGDLLFGLCQLARRLGLSAEDSLRSTTQRFVDRHEPTSDAG
jgi:MazG family protein